MDVTKSIVSYEAAAYGHVRVKLAEMLDSRGITRNKYEVIDRYYKAVNVEMVDLDFIAKVCYVLECKVEDLLEYESEE